MNNEPTTPSTQSNNLIDPEIAAAIAKAVTAEVLKHTAGEKASFDRPLKIWGERSTHILAICGVTWAVICAVQQWIFPNWELFLPISLGTVVVGVVIVHYRWYPLLFSNWAFPAALSCFVFSFIATFVNVVRIGGGETHGFAIATTVWWAIFCNECVGLIVLAQWEQVRLLFIATDIGMMMVDRFKPMIAPMIGEILKEFAQRIKVAQATGVPATAELSSEDLRRMVEAIVEDAPPLNTDVIGKSLGRYGWIKRIQDTSTAVTI